MFDFFSGIVSGLWDGILSLLEPILWLGELIWSVLEGVGTIFVLLLEILYMLVQVFLSALGGLVSTLVSIATYAPAQVITPNNPYSDGFTAVMDVAGQTGLDIFPLVLIWGVYVMTVVTIIRLFRVA